MVKRKEDATRAHFPCESLRCCGIVIIMAKQPHGCECRMKGCEQTRECLELGQAGPHRTGSYLQKRLAYVPALSGVPKVDNDSVTISQPSLIRCAKLGFNLVDISSPIFSMNEAAVEACHSIALNLKYVKGIVSCAWRH